MDLDGIVDLDAESDWIFSDLRRAVPDDDRFSPAWQEQRRAALRERDAAREAAAARARRDALERNLTDTRMRVEQRRETGSRVVAKAVQPHAQRAARLRRAADPVHPAPPPGETTLLRYAVVGETTIAVTTSPVPSPWRGGPVLGWWRWSVWTRREGEAWSWLFGSHSLAEAEAVATRCATAVDSAR